jgi:hypothetical protein
MKDVREPKKALKGHIGGRRPVGRPRRRWIDAVDKDAKRMLKCKNWRKMTEDRDACRRRNEEAKVQDRL